MSSVPLNRSVLRQILKIGIKELCEKELNKKRRTLWVRKWIRRRELLGASNTLLRELAVEDPKEYFKFLRMDALKFEELLALITITPLIKKNYTVMKKAITPKTKLQITLRYLATGDSFSSLQYLFRVPVTTISRFLPQVLHAIYSVLQPFIQVPLTLEDWKAIQTDFYLQWNFPNCCGALDGKHIRIKRPFNSTSTFYHYKGFYSNILFAMVNADYIFSFIDVGSDGRANDSTIFKNSDFNLALEQNLLHWPKSGICVGDDAFPLRHNLLTPYSHRNLQLQERVFNYRLSRARRVSENAFGILASRFRVFTTSIGVSVETTEIMVKVTCSLHNWLRRFSGNTYFPPSAVDAEDIVTGE